MTRRRNFYIGLALLAVVWVGLVLKRYKSGENYQPIHVRFSSSSSEIQNFHVGILSTRNSRGDLIPSEQDPLLWNNSDSISAVKEVLVTVSDSINISDFVVSVRVGQNWVVPATELRSSSDPIVVEGGFALGLPDERRNTYQRRYVFSSEYMAEFKRSV